MMVIKLGMPKGRALERWIQYDHGQRLLVSIWDQRVDGAILRSVSLWETT